MNPQFAADIMVYKNEEEYRDDVTLVEVTDFISPGIIQIAFSLPRDGNRRVYLQLDLSEVMKRAIIVKDSE